MAKFICTECTTGEPCELETHNSVEDLFPDRCPNSGEVEAKWEVCEDED